nr:hypothetical protein [Marinicella sp. W31]MDC2879837.1 hypothetical protein [Marinicella sp. W31]
MLLLNVVGWLTAVFFIGFLFLAIFGIWWLVDLFLISGMIDAQKNALRNSLTQQALVGQSK